MKIIDTKEILTKTVMNIEAYDFKKEIKIHDKLVNTQKIFLSNFFFRNTSIL